MKIFCSRCQKVINVFGKIWTFRLRNSKQDEKGNYIGWNCDNCADMIENGGGE